MKCKQYKLKDIFDLQIGKTPARNNGEYWNTKDYKWISIADLSQSEKYITETKEYISENAILESGIKVIPRNTVVMSFKLSIGKVAITTESMYSNEAIMAFNDKHVVEMIPEYIYYMFRNKKWEEGSNKAVKGKTFNKATLSEIKVEICPLEQQKEIVKKLNKVAAILFDLKKELILLDNTVKARFVEMFINRGYPIKTIADISIGKGEYGAQSASIEYDINRPRYVRITDINDDGTLNDNVASSVNPADDKQFKLEYGDFLFARMGATVGKTYMFIEGNQIFAGYLIRYKLNLKLVNPRYLFWYTRMDEYSEWIKLNQSGAAQPGINAKKYESLQIPLPPIELQNEFAKFVKLIDKSKVAVQKALDEAQLLFDSLMQKYFG